MTTRRAKAPFVFRGHTLDEFQVEAIIALQQETATLVGAPTGTGKSLIAEYLVDDALKRGRRIVYTAPIKALVNQKYRDFRAAFGSARTGIMTGDLSENVDAPLVVMTTEVLRNLLLSGGRWDTPPETTPARTPADPRPPLHADWVVFDEIHYINHPERGTVWEEAIMLLPKGVRLLGLSATVPNIRDMAAWLEQVLDEPVAVVVHEQRAVPLRLFYFTGDGRALTYREAWEHLTGGDLKGDTLSVDASRGPTPRSRRRRSEDDPTRHLDVVGYVSRERLFPCIYFSFSRRACERMARDLSRRRNFLPPHEREAVHVTVRQILQQSGLRPQDVPGLPAMQEMWYRGIGVHHAGLVPVVKHIVEHLLERRILRVVYATETFAVGVNMPVRTVCFDGVAKFDGRRHRPLTQQEFLQMAGRAGRRGLDKVGTVLIRADADTMQEAGWRDWEAATLEPITSRLSLSYTAVLNLLERFAAASATAPHPPAASTRATGGPIRQWLARSLLVWQSEHPDQTTERLAARFAEIVGQLHRLGYLADTAPAGSAGDREPRLTAKGMFCRGIWVKELLVTEMAFDGGLAELGPAEMAGWAAAVVWEARPQDAGLPPAAPAWLSAVHLATDRVVRWAGPETRDVLRIEGRIAPVVTRWAAAGCGAGPETGAAPLSADDQDLAKLLRGYHLEPGDFVTLCRQAVDLLRQIAAAADSVLRLGGPRSDVPARTAPDDGPRRLAARGAADETGSAPKGQFNPATLRRVRDTARAAVAAIDRDVVAASRAL